VTSTHRVQVLLSEEIDGSLRRVKGTPLLAKDRFKSLQKQGLIEPRVRIQRSDRKKRATYQTGDRQVIQLTYLLNVELVACIGHCPGGSQGLCCSLRAAWS